MSSSGRVEPIDPVQGVLATPMRPIALGTPQVVPRVPPPEFDSVHVATKPVTADEVLGWVRERLLATTTALPDFVTLRLPVNPARVAVADVNVLRAALAAALEPGGWTAPTLETTDDGAVILRLTRRLEAPVVPVPARPGPSAPLPTPRESASSWIAARLAAIPDRARPLLEIPLSDPAARAVRDTLRTDPNLRADVMRWLAREGFPRASLDDLDFPGLARITLRHPERAAAAATTVPAETAVHTAPAPAAPWSFVAFFTGTARVPRATVVHWATSRQRAVLWASRLVRSRRWLWAPVCLVASLALWRWLAHR